MSEGKEYGAEIKKRIIKFAYRYREIMQDKEKKYCGEPNQETIEDNLVNGDDFDEFAYTELYDELMEIGRAICNAEIYGRYYAGFVPVAASYKEHAKKKRQQIKTFYKELNEAIDLRKHANKTINNFYEFMAEVVK